MMRKAFVLMAFFAVFNCWPVWSARADEVVLQNGDKLNGKVLSVTTNTLVLQNDNLGRVTLPRAKVSMIVFGTGAAARPLPSPAARVPGQAADPSATNATSSFATAVRGIRDQSNLVQQVQAQILGAGNPEAVSKFNEMLDGLSTGKMSLNDLRQQVQSAADQLRSLRKDLGPDDSGELDGYLAILNQFLQETAATNAATSPRSAASRTGPTPGRAGP